MTLFQITDLKDFMNKLLSTDCFDSFLLSEAVIKTGASYVIDGRRNVEFYTKEELETDASIGYDFMRWKEMRSVCFDMIKGRRVPVQFKFVLHLMPEPAAATLKQAEERDALSIPPEQLKAFVLTVKYDGRAVSLVTGTLYAAFFMDKSADLLWDNTMRRFLDKKGIAYTQ